jgi:uncharacterized membrane protein
VTREAKLIEVYGGHPNADRDERCLRGMVALGIERTVEQDPAFAMRIIVDVADKALSAAINDPTTAVQVLDQLEEVLRIIGTTELKSFRPPEKGKPQHGLVMAVRSWDEYLALGVTEIREYGSTSIQVMRRLRAMLEDLRGEVLPQHRDAVTAELARLDATVAQSFGDSIDLESARIADPEGMGGKVGQPNRHALAH